MPELIRCSCSRINDPWRRFCGGCGHSLAPSCHTCGFVNSRNDRFCGGCGTNIAKLDPLAAGTVRGRPVRLPPPEVRSEAKREEPTTMPIEILEDLQ